MQLDKTRIAIRERGVLDTLDLSLHVLRAYAWPVLVTLVIGAAPLMAVNYVLVDWMRTETYGLSVFPFRYVWHTSILIFLEAPLAGCFTTAYLAQAVFEDRPSLRGVFRDTLRRLPRIAWCQLLERGVGGLWLALLCVERLGDFHPFFEGVAPVAIGLYAALIRSLRPFINEIVLLERNPMAARDARVITVGRRSKMLHGSSAAELTFRWLASLLTAVPLVLAVYGCVLFLSGVFLNHWEQGPGLVGMALPLAAWLVAGYFTVFRFLSYLDLRIRLEGWEVELRMRAEAARLTSRLG